MIAGGAEQDRQRRQVVPEHIEISSGQQHPLGERADPRVGATQVPSPARHAGVGKRRSTCPPPTRPLRRVAFVVQALIAVVDGGDIEVAAGLPRRPDKGQVAFGRKHDDAVAQHDIGRLVRCQHHGRAALHQLPEQPDERTGGARVEARGRLVEEKDRRPVG